MRAATLAFALVVLAPCAARAEPFALPQSELPEMHEGHWRSEEARPFMALRLDAGYLYLKPRVSFGWGKPFNMWGGVDLVPTVTPDATTEYGGLRLQLDWFELRAGARFVHGFSRQYLPQQPSYSLVDLSEDFHRVSNYVAFEAEATAAIPAGPGNILALATAESIQFVPAMTNVFDETLHVVVDPPQVYRARLGYSLILGREKTGRLGLLVEGIEIPDRHAQVFRVGLTGSFDIDDHLQFVATVMIPIITPDSLGLLGADYTELGIRWRWATGHTHGVPRERLPGEQ